MILEIPLEESPIASIAKMVAELGSIEMRDARNFVTGVVCALGHDAFDCYNDGDKMKIIPSPLCMAIIHKSFASQH